jgi:hypothetical protein
LKLGVIFTVNPGTDCGRSSPRGLLILCALTALVLSLPAHAEFHGRASATAQYEHNSNVFDLDDGAALAATGFPRAPADSYYSYGAEVDGVYKFGRQQLYAMFDAKQFNYSRFTALNHNEYDILGRLLWQFGSDLNGTLGIKRSRTMTPFLDLQQQSDLTLSVGASQRESATFNDRLTSLWSVSGSLDRNEVTQPAAAAPDLKNTETASTATLNYTGLGRLTSGLSVGYSTGDFGGASNNQNPTYHETRYEFVSAFKSSRTVYTGGVGYTKRGSSDGNNDTSGLTGHLDFTYQQTPKTTWRVKVSRSINSYIQSTGSEIDTAVGGGLTWRASYKLSISGDYTFSHRQYASQGLQPRRVDYEEYASLYFNFQPRRWLQISPYVNYQARTSNEIGRELDATIFGISVTVMTSEQSTIPQNNVPMDTHWR